MPFLSPVSHSDSKQSKSTRFNSTRTKMYTTVALNHEISMLFVLFIHLENACTPHRFLPFSHIIIIIVATSLLVDCEPRISKYHVDKCRYTVQVFTINNKRTTLLSIFAKIINHAFSSLLRSFHFVSIRHPTIPSLIARISIILFRLYNSSISTTGNDT